MNMIMKRNIVLLTVLAMASMPVVAFTETADNTDYSGTWVLNLDESNKGGGRRGGRMITKMVVSHDLNTIKVASEGQSELTLKPDAGPKDVEMGRGMAKLESKWDGANLVVTRVQTLETRRGSFTVEQVVLWELSEDGNTLTQRITLKSPRGDIQRTLVYDKQ